jgi:hypothetical protein
MLLSFNRLPQWNREQHHPISPTLYHEVAPGLVDTYLKGFYNRQRRHSALGHLSPDISASLYPIEGWALVVSRDVRLGPTAS